MITKNTFTQSQWLFIRMLVYTERKQTPLKAAQEDCDYILEQIDQTGGPFEDMCAPTSAELEVLFDR